ncbi:MAG: porin family protein [Bacteroidia bacterium]
MNTKLYVFIGILMFFAPMANAQSTKTAFAVLGGVNLQNLNGKDVDESTLENDLIVGFHAGINVQIPIAPEFYFQPGLLFSTKGAKSTNALLTSTYHLSYLELPLNLVYKGLLGSGYVMVGFGPYVGYGIGGKVKTEGGPITLDTPVKFQNVVEVTDPLTVVYFKPLDVGGNVFAGYELANGIFFQLNTQLGMIKINPEDNRITGSDKTSVKNTGFGLSLGYRL